MVHIGEIESDNEQEELDQEDYGDDQFLKPLNKKLEIKKAEEELRDAILTKEEMIRSQQYEEGEVKDDINVEEKMN